MSSSNNASNNPDFDNYGAGVEIALDIEWAHAMAPAANIVVLCATPDPHTSRTSPRGSPPWPGCPACRDLGQLRLTTSTTTARRRWEQSWDSTIIQPALAANPDVSVFAASGDSGACSGLIYPSASPEVVSVGGTSLYSTATTRTAARPAGPAAAAVRYSQAFPMPPYQQNDGFAGNNGQRTNPDVAADADPNTGVAVYDPFDFGSATPWVQVGGTSLSSPLWAGMAAIADQGRALAGGRPLGSTEMLTDLYNLANIAPGDFHDITTGNNGYPAGPGYDLVTGIGSPRGQQLLHRPVRLRPGQPGDHRHPAAAHRRHRTAPSASSPRPPIRSASPTRLYGACDPHAAQRAGRGQLHAGDRAVTDGLAVFDGLSLSQLSDGTDYVFQVTFTGLSVLERPTPWTWSRRRPGWPTTTRCRSHRPATARYAAVLSADFDGAATSVITLSISTLPYAGHHRRARPVQRRERQQDDRHHRPGRERLGHRRRRDEPGLRDLRRLELDGELRGPGDRGRPGDRRRLPWAARRGAAAAC